MRRVLPLTVCLLTACSLQTRGPAVPEDRTAHARVPGLEHVRYDPTAEDDARRFVEDAVASEERQRRSPGGSPGTEQYLAISGGADNGAFGAGFLAGWTEEGTRPVFDVVTGTSTGALIAPWAYLGPEYDSVLREVYTQTGQEDIFEPRSFVNAALFDDALSDTNPLRELIERYIDEDALRAIATEWTENGRWLLVATTDLDAGRSVVWNMGAIAASDHPAARDLFCDVLLASAAVPGVFPPVMMDVEVDGASHQELHVDGGAVSQTFFIHSSFARAIREEDALRTRNGVLYILRNAPLTATWTEVDRSTIAITGRAVQSLLQSQGVDDLFRIYLHAETDGVDFRLAYIGADFTKKHESLFDPGYMGALFDYGYEKAAAGYDWRTTPPNFGR